MSQSATSLSCFVPNRKGAGDAGALLRRLSLDLSLKISHRFCSFQKLFAVSLVLDFAGLSALTSATRIRSFR